MSARSRSELSCSSGSVKYQMRRHCVLWDYELQNVDGWFLKGWYQISWILWPASFDLMHNRYIVQLEYQMWIMGHRCMLGWNHRFLMSKLLTETRDKTCSFEWKIGKEMTTWNFQIELTAAAMMMKRLFLTSWYLKISVIQWQHSFFNLFFLQRTVTVMVTLKKRWLWKMLFVIRNYGTASASDILCADPYPHVRCRCSESPLLTLELNQPNISYRQHRSHYGREPRKSSLGIRSVKHHLSRISSWHTPHRLSGEVHNLQCVKRRVRQLPNQPKRPAGCRCLR